MWIGYIVQYLYAIEKYEQSYNFNVLGLRLYRHLNKLIHYFIFNTKNYVRHTC